MAALIEVHVGDDSYKELKRQKDALVQHEKNLEVARVLNELLIELDRSGVASHAGMHDPANRTVRQIVWSFMPAEGRK